MNSYKIRKATLNDQDDLLLLYKKVISNSSGLARTSHDITKKYIFDLLDKGIKNGLALVIVGNDKIIGSMIKHNLEPQYLAHIFAQGSILIDPDHQRKGLGTELIKSFLKEVENNYPSILRVELVVRESSPAMKLYEKLGFIKEGRYERGVRKSDQTFEAGIPMTWFNPRFKP